MHKKISFLLCLFICINKIYSQHTYSIIVLNELNKSVKDVSVKNGTGGTIGGTDTTGFFSTTGNVDSMLFILGKNGNDNKIYVRKNDTAFLVLKTNILQTEETVFIFGSKTSRLNTDAAVAVLNKQNLAPYNEASLVTALNTIPGVKMDERSPGSYRINIRGNLLRSTFGVRNIKVYLNGLPFTDAGGTTYFNTLSPTFLSKIEIIKGPAGSMYGAGTGGVILLSSLDTLPGTTLQISGGSYGSFNAAAQKNIQSPNSYSSISLSHQQADGYRDNTSMQRDAIGYTHTYKGVKNNTIKLTAYYSNLYYKTPGGLTLAQLLVKPTQARPASPIFRSAVAQKAALYLSTVYANASDEIRLNKNWINTSGIYAAYTDFKNPTIRNYEKKYEKGTGGRTSFKYTSKNINVNTGVEYQYSFINTATFGNQFGNKDTLQYHDLINVKQLNIFSQATYELQKNIIVTAGISYNTFTYSFVRINTAENKVNNTFKPTYIPRFSLLKKFKGGSMYAAYSKGYSPPTIDEIHAGNGIFNRNLRAETSANYETGIKINALQNVLYAELSVYLLQLKNTIVGRKDAGGGDFFTNAGNTKQQGLELAITATPPLQKNKYIDVVKFQLTGAATKARFQNYIQGNNNFSGNNLPGTAPFTFSLIHDFYGFSRLYGNITYTYTDKIPLNDANTVYAKAYNLLFVKMGRVNKLSKKIQADVYFAWMKSFNENYSLGNDLNAEGARFYNPAALQTFSGGIKFSKLN